jgi:hypothetical protein
MKSIKLLVLFIFAVLLLSNVSYSQSIPGGTGRYEALGSNPFMLDPVIDMQNNPAWSTMYKNYMFGDIGRNTMVSGQYELSDQYAGINFKAGKDMNLGLILNKRDDFWNDFNSHDAGYRANSRGINEPIVPLQVLFGYATPTFAFGFAPYYTSWSNEQSYVQGTTSNWINKRSASSLGANIGMILKMNQSEWFEGAVKFRMNSFSFDSTQSISPASSYKLENEGGMEINLGLRGWFMANKPNKVALVPFVTFGIYSWNPKVTAAPTAFSNILPKYSYMNLDGGIGLNMPVLENGTLATGFSFGYHQAKREIADSTAFVGTSTEFILPKFNIGLEWKFVDWFSGRLGYSRSFNSSSYKETTGGTGAYTWESKLADASNAIQTINLGIGLHFDRFSLDGTVGERLLKNGPFIITNTGDKNDLYGVFSASYNFNR